LTPAAQLSSLINMDRIKIVSDHIKHGRDLRNTRGQFGQTKAIP